MGGEGEGGERKGRGRGFGGRGRSVTGYGVRARQVINDDIVACVSARHGCYLTYLWTTYDNKCVFITSVIVTFIYLCC